MAINFPSNPPIGHNFSHSGKTWTWNGAQWEGVPSTSGIPFGVTSERPAAELGQPFFNGEESRLELYTSSGWANIVQEAPSVVSISGTYLESAQSSTILINGSNFGIGSKAYAIGSNDVEVAATTTSVLSSSEISAVFSNLSPEYMPYDIKVVNFSNLYSVLNQALIIDKYAVWTTQPGNIGTYIENQQMSVNLSAADEDLDPVSFSVTAGSLPAGLSLNSATGEISGIPENVSLSTVYNFTVNAASTGNNSYRNFSITISDNGPFWSTPSLLPAFTKDFAYSANVFASDDDQDTISYSVFQGQLPLGLSLDSTSGLISGTPTEDYPEGSEVSFILRATNESGLVADRQFSMISNLKPEITDVSLPIFTVGSAYSHQLSAISGDIGQSLTFAIYSGTLPSGISLSPSGLISGTATSEESTTVQISVTDNTNAFSIKTFTFSNQPPTWPATQSLTLGINTTYQLTASNDGSLTYSVVSGTLNSGCSLNASGLLSIGSQTSSSTFTVRAEDLNGSYADSQITLSVIDPRIFRINSSSITGTIGSTYSLPVGSLATIDFSGSQWNSVSISLSGAGGGNQNGGRGGTVSGSLSLSLVPSKTFYSVIGTAGRSQYTGTPVGNGGYYTVGGFNGGGRGVDNSTGGSTTGGGGGASDIRLSSGSVTNYQSASRILVAGGGGGGTDNSGSNGGWGGYPSGEQGYGYGGADPGTQSSGGALNGSFGQGGENATNTGWNGGGGGGWYGGGAQKTQHGGGAGGSSYYNPSYISSFSSGNGNGAQPESDGYGTITILS